ncbi:hypothetical protein BC834DRAFT_461180 [Gloeopeniophorella convolvens]|nr:hypothetical protein BC834DRAFT_461180 [Gloeopeniophorella convolvens]
MQHRPQTPRRLILVPMTALQPVMSLPRITSGALRARTAPASLSELAHPMTPRARGAQNAGRREVFKCVRACSAVTGRTLIDCAAARPGRRRFSCREGDRSVRRGQPASQCAPSSSPRAHAEARALTLLPKPMALEGEDCANAGMIQVRASGRARRGGARCCARCASDRPRAATRASLPYRTGPRRWYCWSTSLAPPRFLGGLPQTSDVAATSRRSTLASGSGPWGPPCAHPARRRASGSSKGNATRTCSRVTGRWCARSHHSWGVGKLRERRSSSVRPGAMTSSMMYLVIIQNRTMYHLRGLLVPIRRSHNLYAFGERIPTKAQRA